MSRVSLRTRGPSLSASLSSQSRHIKNSHALNDDRLATLVLYTRRLALRCRAETRLEDPVSTPEDDIDESVIERFEAAWNKSVPQFDLFVPERSDSAFLGTLQELIIIDLEFRWKRIAAGEHATAEQATGEQATDKQGTDEDVDDFELARVVEDYIHEYPELSDPAIIEHLAEEEFSIRRRYGDQPSAESFCGRFPVLRDRFEQLEAKHSGPIRRPTNRPSATATEPTIADFVIKSVIGEGGMGSVYLAEQGRPVRRRVAVKVIRSGFDSKDVIARFEAERQALAMMDHPNIARIFEAGSTDGGQPYFAMEYVDGVPITDYCAQRKSSIGERLRVFLDVCSAVQHAHQKGILHRDIKPSNVLVADHDETATAKVIDFGLAKAVDSAQLLTDKTVQTHVGQVLGTLKYMSPEQASTSEADIDTRADVYALGVMLYELLTGETPLNEAAIKDEGVLTILERIRDYEPIRPSVLLLADKDRSDIVSAERGTSSTSLQSLLRGDLDWVVMKALEKDRDRRYESVGSLADDVRRFLNDEPVVARPPSTSYRMQKFARKNRVLVSSSLAMLLLLFAGIAATSWQAVRAGRAEDDARTQEEIAISRAVEAELLKEKEAVSRRQAEAAAARAESVLQFVVDSYHSADPTKGAKKDLLARDVLLQALNDVQTKMGDDVEGQASLYWALASSLFGLGDYQAAERAAQLAAGNYIDLFGMESEPALQTQNLIGLSRLKAGDGVGGMEYFTTSLGIQIGLQEDGTRTLTADELMKTSPLAIETLIGIAKAWMTPPNLYPSLAIPEAERAMLAAGKLLGESHHTTRNARITLAEAYRVNGRVDDAITTLQDILETTEGSQVSLEAVEVALQLGAAHALADNWQQAADISKKAVDVLTDRLGASHPRTLTAECQLADCMLHLKRLPSAEEKFLDVRAKAEPGPIMQQATRGLARIALMSDEPNAALELYRTSPEDRAWVHIVTAQRGDAADAYAELLQSRLGQFSQEKAHKRLLNLLLWAKEYDRGREELARYNDAAGTSGAIAIFQNFLDVPLDLIRTRQAIADGEFAKAESLIEKLLDQRVIAPSSSFLQNGEASPNDKPLLSHTLTDAQRAWCVVLQARCELAQQSVQDATKGATIEAFKILRAEMPEIQAELRWTVGAACETIAALCDSEGSSEEAVQWRSQLSELESARIRFTLEDSWQSELQQLAPGLSAVPAE